ncbi:MAG: ImmA/IrrE family metallo-endopeptidase [Bacteroidetes bacterium]|nr:ImmA/IrrE family metallo-endopeptidase [Bacteroidota bacterium]
MMRGSDKMQLIEDKASESLKAVFTANLELPVDLKKVLSHFGLELVIGSFEDKNIAGAYMRAEKKIYVSKDNPYNRTAFTIAHELGHHVLHNKGEEVLYRRNTDFGEVNAQDEAEANWFAAALLMPKDKIFHLWSITQNLEKMATIFGVSSSAMFWRLKNLKLIS